ncbi:MAG: conjugal transfer protein TraR [Hyphomicrobiales bacterium]|nr:MAG: conjugal transfer protein TraR [Hyphomicrobiales bacterium]
MADIADAAKDYEERDRQAALSQMQLNKQYGKSNGLCVDCGLPINERRIKIMANAQRCMKCQEKLEA